MNDAYTLHDIARLILLFIAVTLAMVSIRAGWVAYWEREKARLWGTTTFVLLLAPPAIVLADTFGDRLPVGPAVAFAFALAAGVMLLRTMYTIHPEWTRVRLAQERAAAAEATSKIRDEQDVLRAEDRVSQEGERADSRAMFDAGHLDETTAVYDHRVEVREAQDANREHSHELQDHERIIARADEDDRLRP